MLRFPHSNTLNNYTKHYFGTSSAVETTVYSILVLPNIQQSYIACTVISRLQILPCNQEIKYEISFITK